LAGPFALSELQHGGSSSVILRAMRHVDVCQRVVLEDLRAELPTILGLRGGTGGGAVVDPFDREAVVGFLERSYLEVLGRHIGSAIGHITAAALTGKEEDSRGLPVYFFDQEDMEVRVPYVVPLHHQLSCLEAT
jgi:hypothetical protein